MNRSFALALVSAGFVVLSGCATPPAPLPPELQYRSPSAMAEQGSITGSQESSSWADDFTAFVAGVDGKIVTIGRKGWNVPIGLEPGNRRLLVQFNRGAFTSNAVINVPVAAGDSLELRFSTDVAVYGANSYCDFWVVDTKSAKAMSDIVRGAIRGGSSGGTYIPIYIPKK